MSGDKDSSTSGHHRRSSIGLPMFGSGQNSGSVSAAAAAAQKQDLQQHRRRMSVSTIGLSFNGGGPPQSPSAASSWARRASISSSFTSDESAIDENGDFPLPNHNTPLSRRLSSGAQALRSVRGPGPTSPNGSLIAPARAKPGAINFATSPPLSKGRGEGFNFADNFRSRAERASMSSGSGASGYPAFPPVRRRTGSMAMPSTAEPPAAAPMPQARPPQPQRVGLTDPIQERILKGDFYMD